MIVIHSVLAATVPEAPAASWPSGNARTPIFVISAVFYSFRYIYIYILQFCWFSIFSQLSVSLFPYSCLQLRVLVDYYIPGVVPVAVAGYLPPALRARFFLLLTIEIVTFSIFRCWSLSKVSIFPMKCTQFENQRISTISPNAIKTNDNQSFSMLYILINFKTIMKTNWFLTSWDIDLGWKHWICSKT